MSRKIPTLAAFAIPLIWGGEIHAAGCSDLDWQSQAVEAFKCIGRMDTELDKTKTALTAADSIFQDIATELSQARHDLEGLRTELGDLMSAIDALKATVHPVHIIPRIPKGAIVASESECKTLDGGWSTYTPATARVIVGAGDEFHPKHQDWFMRLPAGGEERRLLEEYQPQSSGGELEVTLTEAQMPEHKHSIEKHSHTIGDFALKSSEGGDGWQFGGDQ
jgi:hypothetical protein